MTDDDKWPTDHDWPEEWLRNAHKHLMQEGGIIGVLYRRQTRRVRELKEKCKEKQNGDF